MNTRFSANPAHCSLLTLPGPLPQHGWSQPNPGNANFGRLLGQLRAELSAGDPAVVAGIAHTLKSTSASVGALALSARCTEIERRLREKADGDLRADVQRLLAEGEAALSAVGSMLRP